MVVIFINTTRLIPPANIDSGDSYCNDGHSDNPSLRPDLPRAQSSRLAVFGGLGMSFNICRGTLCSLAMFTAIRKASSRDSRLVP